MLAYFASGLIFVAATILLVIFAAHVIQNLLDWFW